MIPTTLARQAATVAVSEVFGPTLQGEGPHAGRPAVFLRTAGCNLACSWCDTAYTWDWKGTSEMAEEQGGPFDPRVEIRPNPPQGVAAEVAGRVRFGDRLVISGGEPMTQQPALANTLVHVRDVWPHLAVDVETNGTKAPEPAFDRHVSTYVVSPKLAHSGDPEGRRIVPSALRALADTGRAVWKVVCSEPDDVAAVDELVDTYGLAPGAVWLMPLGREPGELEWHLGELADAAVARRYNLTTRLHVLAWGDERGR